MSLLSYISAVELNSMQSLYLDFTGNSSHIVVSSDHQIVSTTPSAYCGVLKSTGKRCSDACRTVAAQVLELGAAQEIMCPGLRLIRAKPLYAGGSPKGVLLASISEPPDDEASLREVSRHYNLPVHYLAQLARASLRGTFCQPHVGDQVDRLAESLTNLVTGRLDLHTHQRERLVHDALRTWVDTASAAVMLSNDEGQVVFANNRFLELSDQEENNVLGKTRADVLGQVNTVVPDLGQIHYSFDNAGIMVAEALPLSTPGGQQLVVDYLKPQGTMPRRLLEEALNLIDSSILILDQRDRILFANRAAQETLGFNLHNSYGHSLKQVHESLPLLHAHHHFPHNSTQQRISLELASEERVFLYSSSCIMAGTGSCLGSVLSLVDITAMEQAEYQRINKEKLALIGQLAAGMAHELRNPLTVVNGFAQLLKKRVDSEPEATYLQLIIDELKHTVRLIEDFLTLAKPGDPKVRLISSEDFLNNLKLLVESQCLLKEVELRTDHAMPTEFYADEDQLRQVVLNLVKNSLEAMELMSERKLTIHIEELDDGIVLSIDDTGKGMSGEELGKLFTPFYTNKSRGTGLGLSLSQSLVRNMRGTITVESEPNKGTRVSITLPRPTRATKAEEQH